jgi:hypothetical protein
MSDIPQINLEQTPLISRIAPSYQRITPDHFSVAMIKKRSGALSFEVHLSQDVILPEQGSSPERFERALLALSCLQMSVDDAQRLADALNRSLATLPQSNAA